MRFLVTGSTGLIGSQLIKDLVKQNFTVYSCFHNTEPDYGIPIKLDLTESDKIIQTLKETRPDIIIHLAAITDVEFCEMQEQITFQVNTKATEILAKQAAKQKSFFIYVSTDYVFDGKNGLKKEDDLTSPLGNYGKSKLDGEEILRNLTSKWCIARTSTPFGIHQKKKSFPIWVKENLQSKKKIKIVKDQYTSPTYVQNLSRMLIEVAIRQITGVIHLAGASRISRYDLALLVAEKFNLDRKLIIPTRTEEMNWKAKRPEDSSLDVSFATSILNEKPMEIEQGLELLFSEFQ